jgi:hypothetical protein
MLTDDEQAQICTTGDLDWTMHRVRSDGSARIEADLDGRINVRIRPDGGSSVQVRAT